MNNKSFTLFKYIMNYVAIKNKIVYLGKYRMNVEKPQSEARFSSNLSTSIWLLCFSIF